MMTAKWLKCEISVCLSLSVFLNDKVLVFLYIIYQYFVVDSYIFDKPVDVFVPLFKMN